jgi:2-polyprenyl-3-methyl-5-hydroxy-6-metoxy-1,4-benzoquinol methylase
VTGSAPFSDRILACLKAPGGTNEDGLEIVDGGLRSIKTGEAFPDQDGIPFLYKPSAGDTSLVTDMMRSFYEEHPFPSYEGMEEFGALANKGWTNPFSRELLDAIGYNKLVLECGCGTGQLTQFLQLNNNHTLGVDLSLSSLGLAVEHKNRNQLERSAFAQMNIFNLAIKDESFDVVISHGVLHHTYDARAAFAQIVKKVKPGGIVVVGLYNSYARIMTWIRSKLIRTFGPKIDYVVRNRIHDERKAQIWIEDQYFNPHETWHSIGEVQGWFAENGIEYLNCTPPVLGTDGELPSSLFDETDPGTGYKRAITQLGWIGTIAREGALFDVIGKKPL